MFEHQLLESLCDNNCPHQNLSIPGPGCTQCFGCSTRFKHQRSSNKIKEGFPYAGFLQWSTYCIVLYESWRCLPWKTVVGKRACRLSNLYQKEALRRETERERERPQAHQNAAIDPAIVTLPRNSLMLMPVTPLHPCHSLTNQWGFRWITCVWLMWP